MRFCESRFRHPWREYQARILSDFERYAQDGHFHVVAAPGSGKTILGLEVVRRVDRATLVCAPTIALRVQWIDRLTSQFLDGARPDWVSEDLERPGWLTFTTYQGLHAQARRKGVTPLVNRLRRAGIGVLVLDEAHHLKQAWWRTLDGVVRALEGSFIVALTATPPYDVPQAEWNRYLTLAGPIDAEISAPELVLSGDLCPHQDYVYVQRPTPREEARVQAFDEQVRTLLADLSLDRELVGAVRDHAAAGEAEQDLDALLERPEYVLSLAVFLKHADGVVPKAFLETLGVDARALPPFDAEWAESLLDGVVFHDAAAYAVQAGPLRARLQSMGAVERRRVHLTGSPLLERRLRQSPAKLRAVADIVESESRALGDELRLVVLTERIREHASAEEPGREPTQKVGVVPIFERLRCLRLPHVRPCAASGRVGIVPVQLAPEVERALASGSSEAGHGAPLAHDPGYVSFPLAGDEGAALVGVLTRAFEDGRVNVVVGTTALLGEGWDCPPVNAVVLATTIGSYVSTNQSRGRALRRDPRHERKTANIWHPICLDSGRHEGGELSLLRRRFSTFMGPGPGSPLVETGLERLGLPERLDAASVAAFNAEMFRRAEDRAGMADLWRRALVPKGEGRGRPIRETRLPARPIPRTLVRWLPARGLAARLERWLAVRDVSRLTRAVVGALAETKAIETAATAAGVRVDASADRLSILVDGLSVRDEMELHQALQQLFCPLFSPRYLVRRMGRSWVVPRALGESRDGAMTFLRHFRRHVGRARLVYTRQPEGKRLLLTAVQRYLASHLHERPETGARWM